MKIVLLIKSALLSWNFYCVPQFTPVNGFVSRILGMGSGNENLAHAGGDVAARHFFIHPYHAELPGTFLGSPE